MEKVGYQRGMVANELISLRSNSYEKAKTFKYLGSLIINQNCSKGEINVNLKQEIHAIIQSKHLSLVSFSLKI